MQRLFSGSFLNRLILKMTLLAGQVGAFVTRNRSSIQGVAGAIALTLGFWGWTIQKPNMAQQSHIKSVGQDKIRDPLADT